MSKKKKIYIATYTLVSFNEIKASSLEEAQDIAEGLEAPSLADFQAIEGPAVEIKKDIYKKKGGIK